MAARAASRPRAVQCLNRLQARQISSTINRITIEHEELGGENAGQDVVLVGSAEMKLTGILCQGYVHKSW